MLMKHIHITFEYMISIRMGMGMDYSLASFDAGMSGTLKLPPCDSSVGQTFNRSTFELC